MPFEIKKLEPDELPEDIREMKLTYIGKLKKETKTNISIGSPLYGYHHGYEHDRLGFKTEDGKKIELKVPRTRWTVYLHLSSEIPYDHDLDLLTEGEEYDILVREVPGKFLWMFPSKKYQPIPRFERERGNFGMENAYLKGSHLEQQYNREKEWEKKRIEIDSDYKMSRF